MKKIYLLIVLLCLSCSFINAETNNEGPPTVNLIPEPQTIEYLDGNTVLGNTCFITYNNSKIKQIAEVLSNDLDRIYGCKSKLKKANRPAPGGILLQLKADPKNSEKGYRLLVKKSIVVSASAPAGLLDGTATLLQLSKNKNKKVFFQNLKITDAPDYAFRAYMANIDYEWQRKYYTLGDFKEIIDLCRFYKINYLSLHMGAKQFMSTLREKNNPLTPKQLHGARLYSPKNIEDIIAYASRRGVYLIPYDKVSCFCVDPKNIESTVFRPAPDYKRFANEMTKGSSQASLKPENLWDRTMKIAIDKVFDQYSAAYPNEILPYYHIGTVQDSSPTNDDSAVNGRLKKVADMNPAAAKRIIEYIIKKSPKTKVMFWSGISATNQVLRPFKNEIIILYDNDNDNNSDLKSYLKEDWQVVNANANPLVFSRKFSQTVKDTFFDWNIYRYTSCKSLDKSKNEGWTILAKNYTKSELIGGMICTPIRDPNSNLTRIKPRIPIFSEHLWHYSKWPYSKEAFATFQKKLAKTNRLFAKYIDQYNAFPNAPIAHKVSKGSIKGKIRLNFGNSGGYITKYEILRAKVPSPQKAKVIATLPSFSQSFEDLNVVVNKKYYYWVVAINNKGKSKPSKMLEGLAGDGKADVKCYEPFKYANSFKATNGGKGWKTPWIPSTNNIAEIMIDPEGLSYEGINSAAGCYRVKTGENHKFNSRFHPKAIISRKTNGKIGANGTTIWVSYLFCYKKAANGNFSIALGNKYLGRWGYNTFAKPTRKLSAAFKILQPNNTYLFVTKYEFGQTDKMTMWIDPNLETEPLTEDAFHTSLLYLEYFDSISIEIYGSNLDYCIDEIRLGTSWSEVGGIVNKDDHKAPNPSPMLWISPPNLEKDGSVFMMAVDAHDKSGVQYFFECVSNKKLNSGWQDSAIYSISKIAKGTYKFRVIARDKSANKNKTEWSNPSTIIVK